MILAGNFNQKLDQDFGRSLLELIQAAGAILCLTSNLGLINIWGVIYPDRRE